MALETLVGQKAVTDDGINGLPVRLVDNGGTPVNSGGNATLQSSQTFTVSGATAQTIPGGGGWREMAVELNVTAISGTTPSDTVSVQFSPDSNATWCTVASFPAVTATGQYYLALGIGAGKPFGILNRIFHTITGTTPSITCSVLASGKS